MKKDHAKLITRNAENQLAAVLADKVDRFRKSTKERITKAAEINQLAGQLFMMTMRNCALVAEEMEKPPALPPLLSREERDNIASDLLAIATPLTPEQLKKLNQKILNRETLPDNSGNVGR